GAGRGRPAAVVRAGDGRLRGGVPGFRAPGARRPGQEDAAAGTGPIAASPSKGVSDAAPATSDSCASSHRFRSIPAAYPVREPFRPMTRWHGITMAIGFRPMAAPTARLALGIPSDAAISPYVVVSP